MIMTLKEAVEELVDYYSDQMEPNRYVAEAWKTLKAAQLPIKPYWLHNCSDCGVKPGHPHKDNCDVERCSVCGIQRLSCNCEGHDKDFSRWTGIWPGFAESNLLGIDLNEFYSRRYHKIFFVKKGKITP